MNRKGFTLVELLVVIIILLAIMVIALPSISGTLDKSKTKDKERAKELIESAALMYANDNNIENKRTITFDELIMDGYLTKKEKNNCSNINSVTCNISSCDNFVCE